MRLDLHMHTDRSDGDVSPEALVASAVESSLDVISVTDHDTTAGVPAAVAAARGTSLRVIPGVELSSTYGGQEIHILGYGMDPQAPAIRNHGASARRKRIARMESMVERLGEQGVEVRMEAVRAAAGAGGAMMGRPHLARVLVAEGYVESVPQAFDALIGDQHAAFVPTDLGTPNEAVATIRASGGIAVWAHPPMDLVDDLLPGLLDAGLRGLEAYRPGWPPRRTRQVVARAQASGLCVTGGSDFHGPDRNGKVGDFWVRGTLVQGFLDELGFAP